MPERPSYQYSKYTKTLEQASFGVEPRWMGFDREASLQGLSPRSPTRSDSQEVNGDRPGPRKMPAEVQRAEMQPELRRRDFEVARPVDRCDGEADV
jgi:hypothetical protein